MSKFAIKPFLLLFLCCAAAFFFHTKKDDEINNIRFNHDNPQIISESEIDLKETPNHKASWDEKEKAAEPNCKDRNNCVEKNVVEPSIENSSIDRTPIKETSKKVESPKSSELNKVAEPSNSDTKIDLTQQKIIRENQEKLLVALDGRYIGIVDLTDKDHADSMKTSKVKCSIHIDSSNISNNDVNSELLLYKSGEHEPYFKLSFSGDSIYKELTLLNNSKFTLGAFELRHKFELVYSPETSTISGTLFVVSSQNQEWKPVGVVNLVKTL